MKSPDDEYVEYVSDEKLINLPTTSVKDEQAAALQRRLEEIAEDSLSEDNPDFHGLPLYMNWRLQRERDQDRRDQEEDERNAEEQEELRLRRSESEEPGIIGKLVLRFKDVAKRACKWGLALVMRETEIRRRAIVLDDGRHVYVDGTGFADEAGKELTDAGSISEAEEKKKANSATVQELHVADRAHTLAERERTVAQQAGGSALDLERSKQGMSLMGQGEQTTVIAAAGEHARELERTQSTTEQQAKALLHSGASLVAGAALPGASQGATLTSTSPRPDTSDILSDLRKIFAAVGIGTPLIRTSDSGHEAGSLKQEFSVAIAAPRNDNSVSARETTVTDLIPRIPSAVI